MTRRRLATAHTRCLQIHTEYKYDMKSKDIYARYNRNTYIYLRLRLFLDSLHIAGLLIRPMGGLAAGDESPAQPKTPKIGPKLAKPSLFTASSRCGDPDRPAPVELMAQLDSPYV